MNQHPNQFVVDQLVPENRQGGGIYQLNELSVSPTRIVDIDEDGHQVEETIMTLAKSRKFVDRDGNICEVALRTGRVMSHEPEAVRYEQIVEADCIRTGQLPLDECPYTYKYQHIKGGPLVKVPEDERDCGGQPGGCKHMKKLVSDRRTKSRARWEKEQLDFKKLSEGDVKQMLEGMGKVFGEALASAQANGRARLRSGKGENEGKGGGEGEAG